MRNIEKQNRTWKAYVDVCRTIRKIKNGESLGEYPLLDAVSQLQTLLMEAFEVNWETVCNLYRKTEEGVSIEAFNKASLIRS